MLRKCYGVVTEFTIYQANNYQDLLALEGMGGRGFSGYLYRGTVEKDRWLFLNFLRGAYATIAMIVSPFGAFGKWEEEKKKEVGAYI